MVKAMRQKGITVLSHGATGRGNDQVRFQLCTNMLAPDFQVYAPWRDDALPEAVRRPQRDDRLLPRAQAADQGQQGRPVLDRRQPARPDPRGRQARIAGNRPVVHHPRHGRVAQGRPGQAGEGDRPVREGPAGRAQRQEGGRLRGDHPGQPDRRPQRRRHRHAPGREPVRRREVPRRLRGPRDGGAGQRLRVPDATRPRPPGPRTVRPAVAVPVQADLPGLRVRPGLAHGPRGPAPRRSS